MLTPELLLSAYAQGIFPMAESADADEVFWLSPDPRAVLPLDKFHAPKRLMRTLRHHLADPAWAFRHNHDFRGTVQACAAARPETWINPQIETVYTQLHEMGYGHSFEVYYQNQLVGGLYGIAIGGAFFGESMFSKRRDASKLALILLVESLRAAGYTLLDVQFHTDHLAQFGVIEIPRDEYLKQLQAAIAIETRLLKLSLPPAENNGK